MTIKWTPEGKVDRIAMEEMYAESVLDGVLSDQIADALDVAVAALIKIADYSGPHSESAHALRRLGVPE